MMPRYRKKSIPRYKRQSRSKIKLADPAVRHTFQKLVEIRAAREERINMPDFARPDFWEQCERACWERLMALLIRRPIPCD